MVPTLVPMNPNVNGSLWEEKKKSKVKSKNLVLKKRKRKNFKVQNK